MWLISLRNALIFHITEKCNQSSLRVVLHKKIKITAHPTNPSSYKENKKRKENASMAAVCGTLSIHKCNEDQMPFAGKKILSKYLHEKNVCQVEVVISNIPHSLSHRVVEPRYFIIVSPCDDFLPWDKHIIR